MNVLSCAVFQSNGHVHASFAGTVCVLGRAGAESEAALARVIDSYAKSIGGYRAQVGVKLRRGTQQCCFPPACLQTNYYGAPDHRLLLACTHQPAPLW